MQLTEEHIELRRSLEKFIDHEINPHVDDWEREGRFPGSQAPVIRRCRLLRRRPEHDHAWPVVDDGARWQYRRRAVRRLTDARVRHRPSIAAAAAAVEACRGNAVRVL